MRVALVTGTLDPGGAERQLVRLAHELDRRGHTVKIFLLQGGGLLTTNVAAYGLESESWDFDGFLPRRPVHTAKAMLRAARSLRRFRPDVVHAYLEVAYLLAIPLSWLLRVPVRVSGRRGGTPGEGQHYRTRLARSLHRQSIRCSDAIVANSASVAASAIEIEHVDPAKIRVIENGVDIPEHPCSVGGPDPLGIVVANLRPVKNHAGLLRALALLSCPPRIRLVGEGPERASLEDLASDLGLAGTVEFAGFVPDAAACFATAQFSLLVSRYEGQPNAVLESMAHGVPVVATAIPGIAGVLEHDVEGLLVPVGDDEALAAAIDAISTDAALRMRLGAAARERAIRFGWDRCTDAHLDLYRELLGDRGSQGRGPGAA